MSDHADWKNADEIADDFAAEEAPRLEEMIIDLWRRADELHERVAELESQLEKLKREYRG